MVIDLPAETAPRSPPARPFLGTNPLCVAAPAGNEVPFLLDMATSVVSRGKIIVAAQRGEPIPLGWAVDKDGRPTTDPHAALAGAVLPLGGAKGYGIAMFIDILAGVLTGAGFGKYVHNMYENWQQPQNVGHLFIAIDIARFMPVEVFKARMDRYIRDLKSEPTAPGVDEILVPGELEARTARLRRQQGIELPDAVAKELADVGKRYGVRLDDAEWTSMKREA